MTDRTACLAEHTKEQRELHAREGALVGKARELDLGRGELREAELALQAQRAQAQQGEPCTASLHVCL